MDNTSKIFVVIPAFNEATTIETVITEIKKITPNIVVVDDSSSDETRFLAERAGASVLSHLINRGQGAALKTGIDYVLEQSAEIIVTFDADGQHNPTEIPRLVEPIQKNEVDVVLGSRFLNGTPPGIPLIRKLILKGGIIFTKIFSKIKVTDTHNGFRAFSRKAAQKIRINENRMTHASEILDEIAHHFSFVEVPVTITYSKHSLQKGQRSINSIKIAIKFLLNKLTH